MSTVPTNERLLNVDIDAVPTHLYRIVPLERFLQALAAERNVLVSPEIWTDPYEAAQLRTQIESPLFVDQNGVYSSGLRDDSPRKVGGVMRTATRVLSRVFCQCWSDLPESDAMWRLYSPANTGVKLKVRTAGLLSSLMEGSLSGHPFLGAVEYMPQSELDALIREAKTNHLIQIRPSLFQTLEGEAWAKCLLRKREAFKHESEFRLMLCHVEPTEQQGPALLYSYPFDFKTLVVQVELDPRIEDVNGFEHRLRSAGFMGEVVKSMLYRVPSFNIRPSWPSDEEWSVGSQRKWTTEVPPGKGEA